MNIFIMYYFSKFIDILHLLLGLLFLIFIIWFLIRVHKYFSKDNIVYIKSTPTKQVNK